MSDPIRVPDHAAAPARYREGPASLADLLDRVLDKGLVIAGDISIALLDVEVITIKVRLLIASADKAEELGIDWWRNDPHLSSEARETQDRNRELQRRVEELEARLGGSDGGPAEEQTGEAEDNSG